MPPNPTDATTPPTEAGELALPGDLPRWPPVIGGISIGWSVLTLGCGACGVGAGYVMASMMEVPAMAPSLPMLLYAILSLGMSGLLFGAGLTTVLRRPVGRTLHLAWAIGALLLLPVGIYLQLQQQVRMEEWVRNNPDHDFAKAASSGQNKLGETIGIMIGIAMGVAYPLFVMIWFGIVKRTQESMTGGGPPPATLGSV